MGSLPLPHYLKKLPAAGRVIVVFGLVRVPVPLDGHVFRAQVFPGEVVPHEKVRVSRDLRVLEVQEVLVGPAAAGLPGGRVGEAGVGAVVDVLHRRNRRRPADPGFQQQRPDVVPVPINVLHPGVEMAVDDLKINRHGGLSSSRVAIHH